MATNYSPNLPRDLGGGLKQGYPPAMVAKAQKTSENAVLSSILLLGENTSELEMLAVGQTTAIKWLSQATIDSSVAGTSVLTAVATGNWDHILPAGEPRRFVVPVVSFADGASIQGIRKANG